ncbi:hypothetical protein ACVWW2_001716 [Bradyrhizobium sp. LM4.3]
MGLAETAILAGRLHGGRRFHGLAERLHGNARRRRNMLLDRGERCLRLLFLRLASVVDHLPVSLSLALSASGYATPVGNPLRYFSNAAVRRAV